MQGLYAQLLDLIPAVWWPFCRLMAAFSVAPFIGDAMVPMRARIGLALLLAVACLPAMPAHSPIDPFTLAGVAASVEQAVIGLLFGLAFQLTMSVLALLGFLLSSQMGLSMAVMNDPGNGNSSDVVSGLLYLLAALLFFALDGHLVLVQVVYASFRAWPLGGGIPQASLPVLAASVGWVMSAAMVLALPAVFATFVVQAGFGMINRVAPALNLFSLGFPVVTLFGLGTLSLLMQVLPPQYLSLSGQTLRLLDQLLAAGHG
ncbi:flagellar biosynthetic protein FliR [Chromobacterium sp. ATCC 53434]|uniref:flagellar biosynthetic protein FliR n=1 Tax=Chromobacterium TaxID=535 RepID=UPI000C75F5EC|nr:flagellar biosynthetic protein FliR [Chromobacterium sp. ATCC 53434]AUH50479.1 flagellar biosynthetic protein FliR [Chromobacterium sp. ATCC 53434]